VCQPFITHFFQAHVVSSPIKHSLVDPRTSAVCLITKDPQREYKALLEEAGVKFISRVVGIEKLKGKFKPFEARRALLRENALFLADERVIPLLPRLLGKIFFTAKKCVLCDMHEHALDWLISF
jgi:ribosome biogenesis protein UTP30